MRRSVPVALGCVAVVLRGRYVLIVSRLHTGAMNLGHRTRSCSSDVTAVLCSAGASTLCGRFDSAGFAVRAVALSAFYFRVRR